MPAAVYLGALLGCFPGHARQGTDHQREDQEYLILVLLQVGYPLRQRGSPPTPICLIVGFTHLCRFSLQEHTPKDFYAATQNGVPFPKSSRPTGRFRWK